MLISDFFRSSRLSISFVITRHQKALLFFRGIACSERKVPHAAAMSEEKRLPFAGYVFERFRVLFASRSLDFFFLFWPTDLTFFFQFGLQESQFFSVRGYSLSNQGSKTYKTKQYWSMQSILVVFCPLPLAFSVYLALLVLLVRGSWLVPLYLEIFSAYRLGPVFLQRLPL